jgi:CRISPR/Cas system-associated exonuclease Cas4 (RecB family)
LGGSEGGGMFLRLWLLGGGGLLAGHSGLVNEGEQLAEPTADSFFSDLDKARAGDPASQYAVTRALMKHDFGELRASLALSLIEIAPLIVSGRSMRRRRGLTDARTLDLDGRTLFSARLGLAGRPDRIVEEGGVPIPEEWKSAWRVHDSHRAQLGVYLILIEEVTGIRPPHGYVVLGDGQRVKIENSDQLRARVLAIADQIRAARRDLAEIIQVRQPAAKCRGCGVREACGQRMG